MIITKYKNRVYYKIEFLEKTDKKFIVRVSDLSPMSDNSDILLDDVDYVCKHYTKNATYCSALLYLKNNVHLFINRSIIKFTSSNLFASSIFKDIYGEFYLVNTHRIEVSHHVCKLSLVGYSTSDKRYMKLSDEKFYQGYPPNASEIDIDSKFITVNGNK